MKVLIAGGGRTGEQTAKLLLANEHQVLVVEGRREVLARLHRELPTENIYQGDPTDPMVLEQAGIGDADVVAAVTDNDADNLVLCQFAKVFYQVGRTIARVNNPRTAWLFDAKFHVDFALNSAGILAALIEEGMSANELVTLLKLQRGKYSLVEEKIQPGAPAVGQELRNLQLPAECVISAIIRGGDLIVPRGLTTLAAGDDVLAITDQAGAAELVKLFEGGK